MLNRVILMGRITQDLELKTTQSGIAVLTFNLAVERNFVKQGEERQSDFITCVAWRQQAEFISRYFSKGRMIAIEGNLRSRTYEDKNGTKHYVTEVYVDSVSFTGEKAVQGNGSYPSNNAPQVNYSRPASQPAYNEPSSQPISIGSDIDLGGFKDLSNDDDLPF